MSRLLDGLTKPEDLARLPLWAQDRIRNLERDLAQVRKELARTEAQEPTKMSLGFDLPGREIRWLPDEESVTFWLPPTSGLLRENHIRIGFDSSPGILRVMGSDSLTIRPGASNVIFLEVRDR